MEYPQLVQLQNGLVAMMVTTMPKSTVRLNFEGQPATYTTETGKVHYDWANELTQSFLDFFRGHTNYDSSFVVDLGSKTPSVFPDQCRDLIKNESVTGLLIVLAGQITSSGGTPAFNYNWDQGNTVLNLRTFLETLKIATQQREGFAVTLVLDSPGSNAHLFHLTYGMPHTFFIQTVGKGEPGQEVQAGWLTHRLLAANGYQAKGSASNAHKGHAVVKAHGDPSAARIRFGLDLLFNDTQALETHAPQTVFNAQYIGQKSLFDVNGKLKSVPHGYGCVLLADGSLALWCLWSKGQIQEKTFFLDLQKWKIDDYPRPTIQVGPNNEITLAKFTKRVASKGVQILTPNGTYYETDLVNGVINGEITVIFPNGCRFKGTFHPEKFMQKIDNVWDINGQPLEFGTLAQPDPNKTIHVDNIGNLFKGQLVGNSLEGQIEWFSGHGWKFTVEMHDHKITKILAVCDPSGRCPEVELLTNQTSDENRYYLRPNGTLVYGKVKEGKLHGQAQLLHLLTNGSYVKGEFEDDQLVGDAVVKTLDLNLQVGKIDDQGNLIQGKVKWFSGDELEATLKDGRLNGETRYQGIHGQIFKGTFASGQPVGMASIKFRSGETYEGELAPPDNDPLAMFDIFKFEQNGHQFINGKGVLTRPNGEVFEGQLKMGEFCGEGTLKRPDGYIMTGIFKERAFCGKETTDTGEIIEFQLQNGFISRPCIITNQYGTFQEVFIN